MGQSQDYKSKSIQRSVFDHQFFPAYANSGPLILYCRLVMIVLIFSFFSNASANCLASCRD